MLGLTSQTHAQDAEHPAAFAAGSVVRLTWAGERPVRARLLAPLIDTTSTVRFCRYPAPACAVAAPIDTLQRDRLGLLRIERRHGNQARRGAVIGAIGAGAAALLVLVGTPERPAGQSGVAMAYVVSTAVVWAGLGALIGSGHDRWVPAP